MATEYKFTDAELETLKKEFASFDTSGDGSIDAAEMEAVLKQLNEKTDNVQKLIKEVDKDNNGTIEFDEFLWVIAQIRSGAGDKGFANVYHKQKEMIQVKGAVGVHSFAHEEMSAFAAHFNAKLSNDADLDYLLPIQTEGTDLCTKVKDGVLLAKFINLTVRDTIDERALNKKKAKNSLFQINENLNLVISAAKSIGIITTNIGAQELLNGQQHPHLVLGLVWQLVKLQLLNQVNVKNHPELFRLLEDGEEMKDLLKLPADQLLLRWFNYHLKNANSNRRVANFGSDVCDSECYTILLNRIAPEKCNLAGLQEANTTKRAQSVLNSASLLGVHQFIKPTDIVKGNPRLNLAFTAAIFNTCPGLEPLTEEQVKTVSEGAAMLDDDHGDSREERAFRMWINSLGLDGLYIDRLFDDCADGLHLLKVLDFLQPGCVAWNKVEKKPNIKVKKVSNCNLALDIGKSMKFSLVGIGGSDIVDGNKKLLLALVWQMMRQHTIQMLNSLKQGGKAVTEQDMVDWCNNKVRGSSLKFNAPPMASFKDANLSSSLLFFDLMDGIANGVVNKEIVAPGQNDADKLNNAKYCISVARKLGATIFCLPEDLVEVKPKMILTFVGALMVVALSTNNNATPAAPSAAAAAAIAAVAADVPEPRRPSFSGSAPSAPAASPAPAAKTPSKWGQVQPSGSLTRAAAPTTKASPQLAPIVSNVDVPAIPAAAASPAPSSAIKSSYIRETEKAAAAAALSGKCAECDCTTFVPHMFKKDKCRDCAHAKESHA